MRTLIAGLALMAMIAAPAGCQVRTKGAAKAAVRPAAVAGSFYPADPKELAAMVDGFLAQAKPAAAGEPVALVAPHAGYVYSGPVAAYSYALVKGKRYSRVVVIAPSHHEAFDYSAVYDGAAYTTPLGQVPVDQAFAAKLASGDALIRLSNKGHGANGEVAEHALEVQLPFLQRALTGPFQLVPVVMGSQSYEACRALGLKLAKLVQGTDTLIVASSDLSHYHKYDDAVKLDRKTLRAVEEFDYLSLVENLQRQVWEACGGGPMAAAMIASEKLGARRAQLLKYANSGDTTGDKSRVVGYGAVAILKSASGGGDGSAKFTLSPKEEESLLALARKSVETVVKERKLYNPGCDGTLSQERGAFVTLKEHGALRGCIGYVSPMKPLCVTVEEVAAFAAVRDSRFRPVTVEELPLLEYEISVLSPMRRIANFDEIRLGEYGLLLRQGEEEGVFLPQVATEQGWDRTTFLEQLGLKAGLSKDAWRNANSDIFRFTAIVFGEKRGRAQGSQE
jgi:hypothetical protein